MENNQNNEFNQNRNQNITFTKPTIRKESTTNNPQNFANKSVSEQVESVSAQIEQTTDTTTIANTDSSSVVANPNPVAANNEQSNSAPVQNNIQVENTAIQNSSVSNPAKKVKKGKGVGKSIFFGTVSAAAVAGITLGSIYLTQPKEYVLTYILNGEVVQVDVEEDSLLSSIPAPTVTGYTFDGWYVDPTYTTKLTEGYSFTGDVALYPKFTPNKYTVAYHSNNGVGGVFIQDVYFNSEYTTIPNTFTKPNYSFVGWSTDINARYDDTNVIPQNQVALLDTEGATLYAVWKGDDKIVTFDTTNMIVNGEAYTISNTTIPYGDSYTLPVINGTVANSEYELLKFGGYIINGNVYQSGSSVVITENTSISINWQSASSVLNFNIQAPNGEIIANISPMVFYAIEDSYDYVNLPAPDTATNYEFIGWNTKSDGTGTTYHIGDTFTTSESTTVLYAIWQGKTRTLNIYNGGNIATTITCRYGDVVELPTYSLSKYTFLGFNDASNYTGTTYSGNINITFADSVVNLYAEYSRNQITVSFNANGGVGSIDNITINSEELYSFSADDIAIQRDALTRRYYTLAGWSTDPAADPTQASFDISAGATNLPLYAIWSRNQVQVTYASNMGGTMPVAHKMDQGADYTFSEAGFEKEGYYIVEFQVNGTSYQAGDVLPSVEEDSLRVNVVWKKIEKVLFKNAGNISTVETVAGDTVTVEDVTAGTKIIAPYVTLENSYKTNANGDRVYFAGWATTENATKPTVFAKSTELTVTESQQIYYAVYMEASTCLDYTYNSTGDNYTVSLNNSVFDITTADNYVLVVPNIYNGKPVVEYKNTIVENGSDRVRVPIKSAAIAEGVTTLATNAFGGHIELSNITLPNSLTTIGDLAFNSCSSLTTIYIPKNVSSLGMDAFSYAGLDTVVFEKGSVITSLTDGVFSNCSSLTSITIPDTVTDISCAFMWSGLESIVIPDSVTNISSAFAHCELLSSVTLPNSLTIIGNNAFDGCISLRNINIPSSLTTIGGSAFMRTAIETIVLPNTVTNIGTNVFESSSLREISLPSNMQSIPNYMLAACLNLTSVTIPNTVTSIGMSAFDSCYALETVNIPNGVTNIGACAFYGTKITEVTIPSAVTTIGIAVFQECTSLTTVIINTNTAMTYEDHFANCPVTTVTYGEGVTVIPENAWYHCGTLKTVNFPETLTTIGNLAFSYTSVDTIVLPESAVNLGLSVFETTTLTSITLPSNLKVIPNSFLFDTPNLKSITLPEGLTTIGSLAFYMGGIESITIPSSVINVGERAFCKCRNLQSITINTNAPITFATHFDADCASLTTVTYGEGVTSIPENAWNGCETLVEVYVPSTLASVGNYAFKYCTSLTSFEIPNANVTFGYEPFAASGLNDITIPNGMTTIHNGMFRACFSLKSITIPSSVTTIGDNAFEYTGLESITIPSTVTSVGSSAFSNCSSLTNVTINTNAVMTYGEHFYSCPIATVTYGEGVTSIPDGAWSHCGTLKTVNFPETLTTIGNSAFFFTSVDTIVLPESALNLGHGIFECSSLRSITLPQNLTEIRNGMFYGCVGLESINLPASISVIQGYSFSGSGLKTINIPEGVTTIENNAFEYVSGLTSITIPEGVTTIGASAFVSATSLMSVTIPSTVTTIGAGAFESCYSLETVTINTNTAMTYAEHFNGCPIETVTYGEGVTSIPDDAWDGCDTITSINRPSNLSTTGVDTFNYYPLQNFQDKKVH